MSQLLKHLTALGVTHLPKVEVQVQVRRAAGEVSRPVSAAADVSSAAAAARRPGKPAGGSGAAAVVQPLRRIPGLEAAEGGGGVRRPEAL
ncbi:MAG: hypothetical protein ACKPJJ_12600, partial [Planctomycetaceae bacterium]